MDLDSANASLLVWRIRPHVESFPGEPGCPPLSQQAAAWVPAGLPLLSFLIQIVVAVSFCVDPFGHVWSNSFPKNNGVSSMSSSPVRRLLAAHVRSAGSNSLRNQIVTGLLVRGSNPRLRWLSLRTVSRRRELGLRRRAGDWLSLTAVTVPGSMEAGMQWCFLGVCACLRAET